MTDADRRAEAKAIANGPHSIQNAIKRYPATQNYLKVAFTAMVFSQVLKKL